MQDHALNPSFQLLKSLVVEIEAYLDLSQSELLSRLSKLRQTLADFPITVFAVESVCPCLKLLLRIMSRELDVQSKDSRLGQQIVRECESISEMVSRQNQINRQFIKEICQQLQKERLKQAICVPKVRLFIKILKQVFQQLKVPVNDLTSAFFFMGEGGIRSERINIDPNLPLTIGLWMTHQYFPEQTSEQIVLQIDGGGSEKLQLVLKGQSLILRTVHSAKIFETRLCDIQYQTLENIILEFNSKRDFLRTKTVLKLTNNSCTLENLQVQLPVLGERVTVSLGVRFFGRVSSLIMINWNATSALQDFILEQGFVTQTSLQNISELFQPFFSKIICLITPIRVVSLPPNTYAVDVIHSSSWKILNNAGVHINQCFRRYITHYCSLDYLLPFLQVIRQCSAVQGSDILDCFFQLITLIFHNKPESQEIAAETGFFLGMSSLFDERFIDFITQRTFFILSKLFAVIQSKRLKRKFISDFLLLLRPQDMHPHHQIAFIELLQNIFSTSQKLSKNVHKQICSFLILNSPATETIVKAYGLVTQFVKNNQEIAQEMLRMLIFAKEQLLVQTMRFVRSLLANKEFRAVFLANKGLISLLHLLSQDQKYQALQLFLALDRYQALLCSHQTLVFQVVKCLSLGGEKSRLRFFQAVSSRIFRIEEQPNILKILLQLFKHISQEERLFFCQHTITLRTIQNYSACFLNSQTLIWLSSYITLCQTHYEFKLLQMAYQLLTLFVLQKPESAVEAVQTVIAAGSSVRGPCAILRGFVLKVEPLLQEQHEHRYDKTVCEMVSVYLQWLSGKSSSQEWLEELLFSIQSLTGVLELLVPEDVRQGCMKHLLIEKNQSSGVQLLLRTFTQLFGLAKLSMNFSALRSAILLIMNLSARMTKRFTELTQQECEEGVIQIGERVILSSLLILQRWYNQLMYIIIQDSYEQLSEDRQAVVRTQIQHIKAYCQESLLQILTTLHAAKYIYNSFSYYTTLLQKNSKLKSLFSIMPSFQAKNQLIALVIRKTMHDFSNEPFVRFMENTSQLIQKQMSAINCQQISLSRQRDLSRKLLHQEWKDLKQKLKASRVSTKAKQNQLYQLQDIVQNKRRQGRSIYFSVWNKHHSYAGLWRSLSFDALAASPSPNTLFTWTRSPYGTASRMYPFLQPRLNQSQSLFRSYQCPSRRIYLSEALRQQNPKTDRTEKEEEQYFRFSSKLFSRLIKKSYEHSSQNQKSFPATLIHTQGYIDGNLLLNQHSIKFIVTYAKTQAHHSHYSILTRQLRGHQPYVLEWPLSLLVRVIKKRFLLEMNCVQLYLKSGVSLLFRLQDSIDLFCQSIQTDKRFSGKLSHLTYQWQIADITTLQYLITLNQQAGRSIHDLSQYPVFPWVLCNYSEKHLDLERANNFRNLSENMGQVGSQSRRQIIKQNFETKGSIQNVPKYHHGFHYSNPGIVSQFLLRVQPYTSICRALQSGRFDVPDRLFSSIADSWQKVTNAISDVRQLIPQFYYFPELFINLNGLDLGLTQTGVRVQSVSLPEWGRCPYRFVSTLRRALQGRYCSSSIQKWLDLVFGVKQWGKPAQLCSNVFYYLCYDQAVSKIKNQTDLQTKKSLQAQSAFYGKCPSRLFEKPHPVRLVHQQARWNLGIFKPPWSSELGKVMLAKEQQGQWHVMDFQGKFMRLTIKKEGQNRNISQQFETFINYRSFKKLPAVDPGKHSLVVETIDKNTLLLGGYWNGMFILLDLLTKADSLYRKHFSSVVGLSWSGEILVSGSKDGHIAMWQFIQKKLVCKKEIFQLEPIVGVSTSRAMNTFHVITTLKVSVYNLPTGNLINTIPVVANLFHAVTSPLPAFLAKSSRQIYLFSANAHLINKKNFDKQILSCTLSTGGQEFIAIYQQGSCCVYVLTIPQLQTVRTIRLKREKTKPVHCMASNGQVILLGGEEGQLNFIMHN